LPLTIFSPSQLTTISLKPQTRLPYEHSHLPILSISSSSPIINWSVTDVGRFIEEHFPEKNIARVNFLFLLLLFFFLLIINLFYRNLFNKKSMDVHYHY
jgi:hypothetical protein